jgi:2'-5' RNA ligase
MTLLRAFVAIEIPPSIQKAIFTQTERLRKALGPALVRWVPTENLHLTLKFLGDVSPANVELLTQMLTAEAATCAPFPIQVGGLGSFPNPKRARVLWVGLHAPAALESLQHGIDSATARLGYPSEDRPFSPHLTIGRAKQQISASGQQTLRAALEQATLGDLGTAEIASVHLYQSDLQPGGSVYTQLFSAPLKK